MGSNTDFMNELESFFGAQGSDNGLLSNSAASPNQIPSPVAAPVTPTPIGSGPGVRERLRNHLNGAEKRKLEDGGASDLLAKTQRTDDHSFLDNLEQTFKSDDARPEEPEFKDEPQQNPPPTGYGQGGLLAQALMEKRPSSVNGHINSPANYLGGGSPMSTIGCPSPSVPPPNRNIPDIASVKQQLHAITKDPTLKQEQKQAKINEIFRHHPNLQKMLLQSKLQREKMMRRSLGHDSPMMQRDQANGSPMMDYGSGFPTNDGFNSGNFYDSNGFGNAPRNRIRPGMPNSNPSISYPNSGGPPEMWDQPNRLPSQPQVHPPPQYQFRQVGPRHPGMMNQINTGGCYNQGPGDFNMYSQPQPPYMAQRGGMATDPMYSNEQCGPGMRNFNPPIYPGGAMRMGNYPDNFHNEYMPAHQPPMGRGIRQPDYMYGPQNSGLPPQGMMMNPHEPMNPRGMNPRFSMGMSPRMQGGTSQMNPIITSQMNSPVSMQVSMAPSNNIPSAFTTSASSTLNNGPYSVATSSACNGYNFNDDYLAPGSNQNPDENGMDSILDMEGTLNNNNNNSAGNIGNAGTWRQNSSEYRRDMLQRLLNALKGVQVSDGACLESEASAMEEEAFSACDSQDAYVQKLAHWLASKFSLIQESSTCNSSYPDSTTAVPQETVSCPKLSSSTDMPNNREQSDILAKTNPILAETLAADSNDSTEVKDKDSTCSGAISSPSQNTMTTTTTSSSSGICSPSTIAPTVTSPSMKKNDSNFHRPSSDEKVIPRTAANRRASGKGAGGLNNNNNPHSVDSGIGSPRSTNSSSMYSPKLHGTSPSLVAVLNSENSPGKLS